MRHLRRKHRPNRPASFYGLLRSIDYTRNGCVMLVRGLEKRGYPSTDLVLSALQEAITALDNVLQACAQDALQAQQEASGRAQSAGAES